MMLTPEEKVIAAKAKALRDYPFFGYILSRIPIAPKDLPGKKVYIKYNPEFFDDLDVSEVLSVLVHEALHYILGHTERMKELKKVAGVTAEVVNLAEDVVINAIMFVNNFQLPKNAIRPTCINSKLVTVLVDAEGKKYLIEDPDKKSAEMVFHEIADFVLQKRKNDMETACLVVVDDDPAEELENYDNRTGNGNTGRKACSSEQGRNADDIPSPENLLLSAYNYSSIYGKLLNGLDRAVKRAMRPKIKWKEMLRQFLIETIPFDYSFLEPDENSPPGIILPSIVYEGQFSGIIAVDTSGSIREEELSRFLTEIEGLIKNLGVCTDLEVVFCDAAIQGTAKLKTAMDIWNTIPKGGGGTDFRPVFELARRKRVRYLIYFTDGFGEFPSPADVTTKTLWIVTPNGAPEDVFPFGKVVRMNT